MLTYQIRERIFRLAEEKELHFPCSAVVNIHFGPSQPFGDSAGGGRTAVLATPASAFFDANTGRHTIESNPPLAPLEVGIKEPSREVELRGRKLTVRQEIESLAELETLISSISFGMPWLLAIHFADPPFVERVDGELDGVGFRWELKKWHGAFQTTTQESQEEVVANSWLRFSLLSQPNRRRLLAALHYFHVACRLEREGVTPGEFLAEVILNLSKVLEVLFPNSSRDAVRAGLSTLGYDEEEVERDFIPVMLLRNEIDVGHVQLAVFKRGHLSTLHSFLQGAERNFQLLLQRVLEKIESGEWDVASHVMTKPDRDILRIIERIDAALAKEEAERE